MRLRPSDPDRAALHAALRAAIALPLAFAFAQTVFDDPDTSLLTIFTSFALLVLADFSGPRRIRLGAYLGVVAAGVVLVPLGTLCSRSPVLAAAGMAVLAMIVLYAGILNGYFAAAGAATLMLYVLPVMVPAHPGVIPDRLLGLAIGAAVSLPALMLLWPRRPHDDLRGDAAAACRALAALVEAPAERHADGAAAARDAVGQLRRRFVATPYRPTGSAGASAALAALVDEIGWVMEVADDAGPGPASPLGPHPEMRADTAAALRAGADTLEGRPAEARAQIARMDAEREAVLEEVVVRLRDGTAGRDAGQADAVLRDGFRLRVSAYGAREIDRLADAASRPGQMPRPRLLLAEARRLAADHASLRSAWLRNTLRGATGLTAAVLIGQLAGLQHGFWVVLGTLSVLRSSALSTGATVLEALGGTVVGIVAGSALIAVVGSDHTVLWIFLPFATLLAAYAPRAISFALGQAGFTMLVLILFDLLQPQGWQVGLVRAEDIAIGSAISLAVGLLLWPRGTADLVRGGLAGAFGTATAYVHGALGELFTGRRADDLDDRRAAAIRLERRVDAAVRQRLAERAPGPMPVNAVTGLAAGAVRIRVTADAARDMAERVDATPRAQPGAGVIGQLDAVAGWYATLGRALARDEPPAAPDRAALEPDPSLLAAVRAAAASGDDGRLLAAVAAAWGGRHLRLLAMLERSVAEDAAALPA
jgi:uncharacterized membrane protein YccC